MSSSCLNVLSFLHSFCSIFIFISVKPFQNLGITLFLCDYQFTHGSGIVVLSLSCYIYSYWSNPEKIDNIELLRQMEDSLRDSIGRLRQHKVCRIWKLSYILKISSVNVSLLMCSGSLYCVSKLSLLCRKTWEGTSSCPR